MQFSELREAVDALRRAFRTYNVGETALSEVHIRQPAKEDDEASFMRLVNWTYVLLFEAGRVAIPYLMKLPSNTGGTAGGRDKARRSVHDLRTWMSHNVGFSSEREAAITRRVGDWFLSRCEQIEPRSATSWRKCFGHLCEDVWTIVSHCQKAFDSIVRDEDDVDDLRRRIDRSWSTEQFDRLVGDVCVRLSIANVDVPKFRSRRLAAWREVLDTVPADDDPRATVIRIIERDLLNHTSGILPIGGEEIMATLELGPGPEIGAALRHARELHDHGIRDREQLLQRVRDWHTGRNQRATGDRDGSATTCADAD